MVNVVVLLLFAPLAASADLPPLGGMMNGLYLADLRSHNCSELLNLKVARLRASASIQKARVQTATAVNADI